MAAFATAFCAWATRWRERDAGVGDFVPASFDRVAGGCWAGGVFAPRFGAGEVDWAGPLLCDAAGLAGRDWGRWLVADAVLLLPRCVVRAGCAGPAGGVGVAPPITVRIRAITALSQRITCPQQEQQRQ